MGLFNLLKNGITIEKKKKTVDTVAETEQVPETTTDEIDELATEPTNPEPEPIATPEPTFTATPTDKKKLAEYILYGDTNVAPKATVNTAPQESVAATTPVTPTPVQQTYNAYSSVTANFNSTLLGQATANQNLLVIAPKSPDEISAILSNLASGNACIVSLASISDPQRHLDYICGFMNAIGGTIMQRTPTEYILTPKGVGIKS